MVRVAYVLAPGYQEGDYSTINGKKIGVGDNVLQKPGRLTDEEFAMMKAHTVIGSDILSETTGLLEAAEIVRHHHER